MSYRIVKTLPAIEWPVKIPEPKNGGEVELHEVSFTFKQLTDTELQNKYQKQTKREFLEEVITNWSGFEGEDGSPVPFCQELLGQGIEYGIRQGRNIRGLPVDDPGDR